MKDQDDRTLAFVERSDGGAIDCGCGQATWHAHSLLLTPDFVVTTVPTHEVAGTIIRTGQH
jgi:hypothetical protein